MNGHKRWLLYLYSNKNVAGTLLALLGLVLFFLGIIGNYWFIIIPGLYLVGALLWPRNPQVDLSMQNQVTAEQIQDELDGLIRKIRRRVPKDVLDRVQSIRDSIVQVLPQIVDLSSGDRDIYMIKQTALDYLPEALQNYLKLPTAYANLHAVKDGKTPHQLLLEQLTLLDDQMKQIVDAINKNDVDKLIVHGRFLQDTFGKADLLADMPAQSQTAGAGQR